MKKGTNKEYSTALTELIEKAVKLENDFIKEHLAIYLGREVSQEDIKLCSVERDLTDPYKYILSYNGKPVGFVCKKMEENKYTITFAKYS